jgi:hypothetical protein
MVFGFLEKIIFWELFSKKAVNILTQLSDFTKTVRLIYLAKMFMSKQQSMVKLVGSKMT